MIELANNSRVINSPFDVSKIPNDRYFHSPYYTCDWLEYIQQILLTSLAALIKTAAAKMTAVRFPQIFTLYSQLIITSFYTSNR